MWHIIIGSIRKIFKRHNRIKPINERYIYIKRYYTRFTDIITQYKYFIHNTFYDINSKGPFILTNTIYNRRNEIHAYFNGNYNSILNELGNNKYETHMRNNIQKRMIEFKIEFNKLNSEFINNIKQLNDYKCLKVEKSCIYTKSFLDLLKENNIPRPKYHTKYL